MTTTVRSRSIARRALASALLLVSAAPAADEPVRLVTVADAFVAIDYTSGRWTIGTDLVRYSLDIDDHGHVSPGGLTIGASADPIGASTLPDAQLTIGGRTVRLGAPGSGFSLTAVTPSASAHFVALALQFVDDDQTLAATRHYVAYPATAAVEMWTEIGSLDGARHSVANLNAFDVTVPPGDIDYLLGHNAPESEGGPFMHRSRQLAPGERFELGSFTLSTETAMPLVSIGNGHRRVFAGLIWSGGWSATLERRGEELELAFGLPAMSAWVRPEQSVEGPHGFIGAVWDVPGADGTALDRFVRAGRAGREFPAWTTFNTWFVRGINVDEPTVFRDIDAAAAIGLELFQLDAGWYPRSGAEHAFDFTPGLGSWTADGDRFPRGLSAVAAHAHEQGMKFGLWVEPERVALDTVGGPGLADVSFLAMQDGAFAPGVPNDEARDAQICLANPAAREWVLRQLTRILDEVQPDNLKWDVNRWIRCTRADHDHPVDGGNYEHTRGLYELLAAIRQRYPQLTIENCSQGGHRLDFAMARLTDTAWMDDRTTPSAHVRRNLQGLTRMFPAAYLFSYLMPHPDEPIRGSDDLPMLARSRMPGVFGVAAELTALGEGELNQIQQAVQLARQLRVVQADAVTWPLTPQRPGPGEWEVVQQMSPSTGVSLLFAFANGAPGPIVVSLRGIAAGVTYELRSADRGTLGAVRGADLIASGLELTAAPESGAQILVLDPIISGEWRSQQKLFASPHSSRTTRASSSQP